MTTSTPRPVCCLFEARFCSRSVGASVYDVHNLFGLCDLPSPSLSEFCVTVCPHMSGIFYPSLLCADVIYESPLKQVLAKWTASFNHSTSLTTEPLVPPGDNMKPAVLVVLAIVGLGAAAPHPDGGQTVAKKCHMTYEIVYRQKCDTVPVTVDKRTEKKCSTSYDTVYERVCKTIDKETRCQQVPKMIPKKSCRDVPVQTVQRVPVHCRDFP